MFYNGCTKLVAHVVLFMLMFRRTKNMDYSMYYTMIL